MPSISDTDVEMQPLPVDPRYTRRNASRAMGGSLIRGIVELVTNARDSGFRLVSSGRISEAELTGRIVDIEYHGQNDGRRLVVRDRFEGMTADIMRDRLLAYGRAASGFEESGFVRGLNARGAKDTGALGRVVFESIHGEEYAECTVRSGMYSNPVAREITSADRERLGIPEGNGTVVTLEPLREITFPNFERLAHDLNRHIELRYRPPSQPRVSITLREVRSRGSQRESPLDGFSPTGEQLLALPIDLPEFNSYGDGATITIFRSASALVQVGLRGGMTRLWRSEAGIVVGDGRTAHDVTFFHARGSDDDVAQYVFGELHLPQIPALLQEYEEFELARATDPSTAASELNPSQVTDPDRLGLNREHPFIQAVEDQVRPLLAQIFDALQEELTPSAQDRVSAELRDALDKLGEELAERLEDVDSTRDDDEADIPWGLSVVPPGVRLELERSKRLGVYYRVESWPDASNPVCAITCQNDAVSLSATEATLEPVPERPGVFRGGFDVTGKRLIDMVAITVQLNDDTVMVRASVREPPAPNITLDKDLQFSRRRYVSVPRKRKRVEVFADASLADRDVRVSTASDAVALSQAELTLTYDQARGIAAAGLYVESSAEARDMLRVVCGDLDDEAEVVFREVGGRPRVQFIFDDVANFGPGRRFKWDRDDPNKLHFAAKHSTLGRVLGPEGAWPGQNLPQTRAILAELISEAFVDRRMQGVLPSLGVGPENSVDPVEYESYRYRFFEECFSICHKALTPPYEA